MDERDKEIRRLDFEADVVSLKRIIRRGTDVPSDLVFYDGHVRNVYGNFYLGEWGEKRTVKNGMFIRLDDVAEAIERCILESIKELENKSRLEDLKVFYESDPKGYGLSGSRGSTDNEGSYLTQPLESKEMEELILRVDSRIRKLYPKRS